MRPRKQRRIERHIRVKHASYCLTDIGVWMTCSERQQYTFLKQERLVSGLLTAEQELQFDSLQKTARKYRKLRRRAGQCLKIESPRRVSLYGLVLYLDMKADDRISRKGR